MDSGKCITDDPVVQEWIRQHESLHIALQKQLGESFREHEKLHISLQEKINDIAIIVRWQQKVLWLMFGALITLMILAGRNYSLIEKLIKTGG